jgi:putative membrane protein
MTVRGLAAAALATVLMAPGAMAQVTQQDTAQDRDTTHMRDSAGVNVMQAQPQPGVQDTSRITQPGQMQQGQQQGQMQRQQQGQMPGQRAGRMNMAATDTMPLDSAFLVHAHSGNIKEVRLGELAAKQAEDSAVKSFGKQMVQAHRAAYKETRILVDTLNAAPLDSMMPEHEAEVDRFRSLQGEAFDSAYMTLMVQDHAKEVAEYRNQVQFGNQTQIRRYALATLPILRDHFELAQRTARGIGVNVQTPLAGEMEAGPNDTTAYMPPRDSVAPIDSVAPNDEIAPADTSMMPQDITPRDTTAADTSVADTTAADSTMVPSRDTTLVPGENVPRQAGTPQPPAVRPDTSTANRPMAPGDTLRPQSPADSARPGARDSTP